MKNTKKLLMILSAAIILVATAFAVVSSAVVAGEGTTINEYKNMKRVEKVNFEDGKNTYSLANKGKLPSAADQANSGKATLVNNIWQGAPDIYDGALSRYFYMLDYSYNSSVKADLYIQPVLGVLNNVDKTPTNGFVSEFDIAFFSPTEIAEYTEKLIPKLIVSAREQWYSESKPYGFDLIERKLGGLLARTTSCKQRIIDYVNGKIDSIPELSEEILPYGVKGESMLAAGEKILSTAAVM